MHARVTSTSLCVRFPSPYVVMLDGGADGDSRDRSRGSREEQQPSESSAPYEPAMDQQQGMPIPARSR